MDCRCFTYDITMNSDRFCLKRQNSAEYEECLDCVGPGIRIGKYWLPNKKKKKKKKKKKTYCYCGNKLDASNTTGLCVTHYREYISRRRYNENF